MKINFEFDTNSEGFYDYRDNNKLYIMQNADNLAQCLEKLRETIKGLLKYDNRELIPKDEIDDKFWEITKDYDINFERMGY